MEVIIQEDANRITTQVVINCKEIDHKVRRIEKPCKAIILCDERDVRWRDLSNQR